MKKVGISHSHAGRGSTGWLPSWLGLLGGVFHPPICSSSPATHKQPEVRMPVHLSCMRRRRWAMVRRQGDAGICRAGGQHPVVRFRSPDDELHRACLFTHLQVSDSITFERMNGPLSIKAHIRLGRLNLPYPTARRHGVFYVARAAQRPCGERGRHHQDERTQVTRRQLQHLAPPILQWLVRAMLCARVLQHVEQNRKLAQPRRAWLYRGIFRDRYTLSETNSSRPTQIAAKPIALALSNGSRKKNTPSSRPRLGAMYCRMPTKESGIRFTP